LALGLFQLLEEYPLLIIVRHQEGDLRYTSRPRYGPPWAGSSEVRPTQGNPWVGRVLGLYGPPFAGRPMGPKGPINLYLLA
jgi:hypothetical protein